MQHPTTSTIPVISAPNPTTGDRLSAATTRIQRLWNRRPRVALILGSGLHGISEAIAADLIIPFHKLPGMLAPTATGHRGRILCGSLAGLPVIACEGRLHGYEGHDMGQLRFPIRLFDELGCDTLILSNAAGGVNPNFEVGDVMVVTDHVDLIGRNPLTALSSNARKVNGRVSCYDHQLSAAAYRLGQKGGHPVRRGTYAAMTGPNYETRAEYRMLCTLGIDTVGMSTAPEADEAFIRGMRVLALSTVTNICDPDRLGVTSGEAVIEAAQAAQEHVIGIVWDLLATMTEG